MLGSWPQASRHMDKAGFVARRTTMLELALCEDNQRRRSHATPPRTQVGAQSPPSNSFFAASHDTKTKTSSDTGKEHKGARDVPPCRARRPISSVVSGDIQQEQD